MRRFPDLLPALLLLALVLPGPRPARADGAAAPPRSAATVLDSLIAAESRVRWQPGPPDSALARAVREGRPAFLDFYADWCAPCRWMDRAVYNDPLLGEVSEGVAMVRIDIDQPAGRALAQRFGVFQYPTLVHLAPDGRETLRWPGPLSLRDTRLNLGQAAFPAAARAAVEAGRMRDRANPRLQSPALLWYGMRGEVERVRAIVDTLEGRAGTDASARAAEALAPTDRAVLQLDLGKSEELAGRTERALAAYRRALSADPGGLFAWRAWLGVSTCLEATGDRAGAGEAATRALALNPQAWLRARVERLALAARLPALPVPPGVD